MGLKLEHKGPLKGQIEPPTKTKAPENPEPMSEPPAETRTPGITSAVDADEFSSVWPSMGKRKKTYARILIVVKYFSVFLNMLVSKIWFS